MSGAAPGKAAPGEGGRPRVRGSTTIAELLRRHPDGSARRLLAAIGVPCAYCGGAPREPITQAARRHGRDPGAFLRVFQALDEGWPADELIAAAQRKTDKKR
ncbi:hypothetical protein GCM10011581_36980 [Saccharopolyspora subtropica]|uniref:DUF1858 domain-containing protein n=1 Tax=Saccharopolyspora thermophila TaxID=89367 RepID=A0A917K2L5_9PSEU|nr:hypothetical protein [Saccharopolyspora subtropica]GGI96419.1 hypothetical protein GCM10011581_36980 [Saccharopolyspora subtropica]